MHPALLLLASIPCAAPATVPELKLPPGFHAYQFSDQSLANDIYTMTTDDAGRVLVAGRGYVRVLVDDDGDGRADRAIDLLDGLKDGPMGLLAEGDSLYVVVDGGLKRYRGYTGKDKLTAPPELILAAKTDGEHAAHQVRRGPDGWLYLLCGNNSGLKTLQITSPRSPVKDPVAGVLLRISPDGKTVETVADGFRNAYGFDFNLAGEPFTYDSDNERCVGLPWHEGCRFYHVVPGGNYGWRSPQLSQTWRKPPYFADVVPPICDTGRGSPTGVACYRHTQFPAAYRGGFFLADWTFGRVYFVRLEPKGSTYTGKPEVFLEAAEEYGFAPTALAVHPKTGELLVSIGGRGTRGGVYRVRCDKGDADPKPLPMAKRSLEWDETAVKQWTKVATGNDPLQRRQALELMLRWRDKIGWGEWLGDAVRPNLSHADPVLRAAAGRVAVKAVAPYRPLSDPLGLLTVALFTADAFPDEALHDALAVLEDERAKPDLKLIAARIVQLACGDLTAPGAVGTIAEGYTFRRPMTPATAARIITVIRPLIDTTAVPQPPSSPELDREIARIIGGIGPAVDTCGEHLSVTWLGAKLRRRGSSVQDDIHYLAVTSRLSRHMIREQEQHVRAALLGLDLKAAEQKIARDSNWPLRINELAAALIPKYPDSIGGLLRDRDFGRPEHLVFVKYLDVEPATKARVFMRAIRERPDDAWTPGVVALFAALPAQEVRPTLLKLWDRGGLEDAIIPVLAKEPTPDDRTKFLTGLRSFNPDVVRVSAVALAKLPKATDATDLPTVITALRRQPNDKAAAGVRDALTALLRYQTDQEIGPDPKAWADWLAKAHPDLAAKLAGADGFDTAAWKKREAAVPWADGDPVRGRAAFTKATCAACHDGGGAVGPSLVGVAKRFGRDDLLTAILQPSKDVSPRYRPVRITTTDGKAVVGMLVYEATSGVILQTGADASMRITGEQIESKQTLETSFMPTGLLDKLSDTEVADLIAYLRTLDDAKPMK